MDPPYVLSRRYPACVLSRLDVAFYHGLFYCISLLAHHVDRFARRFVAGRIVGFRFSTPDSTQTSPNPTLRRKRRRHF